MKLVAIDDNNVAHTLPQGKEIRNWISTNRQRLNMSLAGIAKRIGVKRQAVWSWEHGNSLPTADNLVKMMSIFIDADGQSSAEAPDGQSLQDVESVLLGEDQL